MFKIFTLLADYITFTVLSLSNDSQIGNAVHFFIEDTTKIFFLILIMIYLIALVRSSLNTSLVRDFLHGKSRWFGYIIGAAFGAVTPFCSCSSIPLFLGFTSAGIPIGVTLSFLITSPLLNEVALVLLGSILGWKFTLIYIASGLGAGILGGLIFDTIGADKYLQPLVTKIRLDPTSVSTNTTKTKVRFGQRHKFAQKEAIEIFSRIWKWVILGIGIGSILHGFVPHEWITQHLGSGSMWTVPTAVLLGIPLYCNASGMIPIIETLMEKGLPAGTALAFMMSTVGASFPEFILLKQVLQNRLLIYLFIYFIIAFTTIGWIINVFF